MNKERARIVNLLYRNGRGKGLMPTREEAVNFFKIFSSSNEQVRKKWFHNRKELFEVDFSKYPEKPYCVKDYTFAFKIFAELWSMKKNQDKDV